MTPTPSQTSQQPPDAAPRFVVGIGASAGGLEALQTLFSFLPADTGAGTDQNRGILLYSCKSHLIPDSLLSGEEAPGKARVESTRSVYGQWPAQHGIGT